MAADTKNRSLSAAKAAKEDEFYTQLTDIERELKHYKKHFKGKIVYLNCDDPRVSNFFHYFSYNFEKLGLKKLIATCYRSQSSELFSQNDAMQAAYLEYEGDKNNNMVPDPAEIEVRVLKGDGDFRSAESIALLKQADIVVTNPPFSLFREYVTQLIENKKKFIILANQNAIKYKGIFPLIKAGKLWLGANSGDMAFKVPPHYKPRETRYWEDNDGQKWRSFGNMCWFTNLDFAKRHEDLILYKKYDPKLYPKYDNFDAIEVSKVADIPVDFSGVMGVTIGFLTRYNPSQFEIVGISQSWAGAATKTYPTQKQFSANGSVANVSKLNDAPALRIKTAPSGQTYYKVGGKYYISLYARVFIKHRKVGDEN